MAASSEENAIHEIKHYDWGVDVPTLPRPKLEDFVRHAQVCGPEGVYETAQHYLHGSELSQLILFIGDLEKPKKHRFRERKEYKLNKKQKLLAVEQLMKDNVPNVRIAKHLGVTVQTVRRWRKELEQRQEASTGRQRGDSGEHLEQEC